MRGAKRAAITISVTDELGCMSRTMAIVSMRLIIRRKAGLAPAVGPELIALHRLLGLTAHALTLTAHAVDLLDEVPNLLRP